MTTTRMTQDEREAFLGAVRIGVLSIPRGDAAPLSAPIWYDYSAGEIHVLTHPQSQKGRLLAVGVPVTLVAQQEALPYAYVSVEGTVISVSASADDSETAAMAVRYLGEDAGAVYTESTAGEAQIRVTVRPDRWLTVDYAKSGLADDLATA